MRAHADNRRLGLEAARDIQQIVPQRRVGPSLVEVGQPLADPFDAEHVNVAEPDALELGTKLLGAMEVGGGEVLDPAGVVAMLPGLEIAVADLDETRIGSRAAAAACG